MTSVAVYADVDDRALHTRLATDAVRIGGPGDAVAAYLDIDAVVRGRRRGRLRLRPPRLRVPRRERRVRLGLRRRRV